MSASGKLSLKIIIDKKSNKVVFAEVGKEFVDFIFKIMALPLSIVTRLLSEKQGMVGCIGALYKSIESLGAQYYAPNKSKQWVLRTTSDVIPLLSLNGGMHDPTTGAGGYVQGAVRYMVMDNLAVEPMSISLIRSLIKDFDSVEEKEVEFGVNVGLALLKASLEIQGVLTSVFLGKKV